MNLRSGTWANEAQSLRPSVHNPPHTEVLLGWDRERVEELVYPGAPPSAGRREAPHWSRRAQHTWSATSQAYRPPAPRLTGCPRSPRARKPGQTHRRPPHSQPHLPGGKRRGRLGTPLSCSQVYPLCPPTLYSGTPNIRAPPPGHAPPAHPDSTASGQLLPSKVVPTYTRLSLLCDTGLLWN